jgi:hypothetical protein
VQVVKYRLKIFLEDGRTAFYQDREFLCEIEAVARPHTDIGRKVQFFTLDADGREKRFMHSTSDPLKGKP